MENFNEALIAGMKRFNIELTEEQINRFNIYCNMLIEWNSKMNLTAIKEPTEIAVKHFVDSCSVLNYVKIKKNAKVIDIGTGAGFPGIPLKILREDLDITLLDSLNKRLVFLNEVAKELNLELNTVHSRAEDLGRQENHREQYDIAISRAVAPLNVLSEYSIPFVRKGGRFISMKGPNVQSEIDEAKKGIRILGGKCNNVVQFSIGDNSRSIVIVDKLNPTPYTYPRHGSKISKKPL
ncbi:MAG: 16S rRNA (guanine(527)-N(7))-methyltransferase RsmG [Clostridia bacterium]|nr:16S rRNA (guanine(527)-N(7))-methyltransferase RsmG [Clostridia bacterium]MEE1124531.1 16S rRNA (guanine(527)-N(7))-methyltransferase RsmG [Acutalibacteraceae bacterium]